MPIDVEKRCIVYVGTWLLALLPLYGFAPFVLLFPAGLFFASGALSETEKQLAIAGWLLYAIHAAFFFLVRTRTLYFLAYAVLVIMLITNVVGCSVVFTASMNKIH